MKDEIKEILNKLIKTSCANGVFLTANTRDKIIDYITNLQEKNNILKENAIHNDKVVDKAKWNEMIYKSRNEKAIKLLKEAGCYEEESKQFCDDVWEELPDILSALEGNDKE